MDVMRLVDEAPNLQFVYTDQDRLSVDGHVSDPSYKSAWSPDLLRSTNCIVHLCCYRRSLLDAIGGVRSGYDGSQDYDLLLRVADHLDASCIGHVARPRYHWRASAGSVAADPDAKPWAYDSAVRALEDSLRRRGLRGRVTARQTARLVRHSVRRRARRLSQCSHRRQQRGCHRGDPALDASASARNCAHCFGHRSERSQRDSHGDTSNDVADRRDCRRWRLG